MTPEAMQIYYSTVDTAEDAVPVDEIAWDEWASDRSEGAPYGSQPQRELLVMLVSRLLDPAERHASGDVDDSECRVA